MIVTYTMNNSIYITIVAYLFFYFVIRKRSHFLASMGYIAASATFLALTTTDTEKMIAVFLLIASIINIIVETIHIWTETKGTR